MLEDTQSINKVPLVSVIMPTYNCGRYLKKTIECVLSQTFTDFELVITDDCSTDPKVHEILSFFESDPRVRVFYLEKNSGAGVARNKCTEMARGRYIAFCDGDDYWMPAKLEKQLKLMQEKDCCLSYTSYLELNDAGNAVSIMLPPKRLTFRDTLHDDKIGFSTAMYDTSKFGKFYMPTIRRRQDWALVLLILQKCKEAFGVDEVLTYYNLSRNSLSRKKIPLVRYAVQVYQIVLGYSKVHSYLYLFFCFLPAYVLKKLKKRRDIKKYLKEHPNPVEI